MHDLTPLFSQGVAVVVLAWFMLRMEGIIREFTRQMQINTKATLLLITNAPGTPNRVKEQAEALLQESQNVPSTGV